MEVYSCIGLVTTLYIEINVSLCCPHFVEEKTLSMSIVLDTTVLSMCFFVSEFIIESQTVV